MVFAAEEGLSKSGKHPLLIYRSTDEPDMCFKFCHTRDNLFDYGYVCLGCKRAKDDGKSVYLQSIRVSHDYSEFFSDPEELFHKCVELGYTYDYLSTDVQQELRFVFNNRITLILI
jgi:hypothetical protein